MRTIRQIFHGCKKHQLRYFKPAGWWSDEYKKGKRSLWICTNCYAVVESEIDIDLYKHKSKTKLTAKP